jgi:hypothetical protein
MKSQGDEASHRLFFSIFGELGHFLVFGFFLQNILRRAGWGGGPTFEPDFDRAGPRLGSRSP